MLDYISVIVLGVSALIPFSIDYIGVPNKYKRGLVIICMIALIISIFFSFKGVSDSQEKDKELEKLTKRNVQIRDSVVIITENTKRLRANLMETLGLLEEFESKSTSSSTTIRQRLSRSAKDLKDIIDQSYSLASTSTQTQKLLAQVINYQYIDSLYSANRAKRDSLEVVKSDGFRTFIALEMADNKEQDSLNWATFQQKIAANSYKDSVRLSALLVQVTKLENAMQKQEERDSVYLKSLDKNMAALQNTYQNLADTLAINYNTFQNQINRLNNLLTNSPNDIKAIKTAIGNMNGNFARQQNMLNQLNEQVTKTLKKLEQNQNHKPFSPPRGGSLVDTLD